MVMVIFFKHFVYIMQIFLINVHLDQIYLYKKIMFGIINKIEMKTWITIVWLLHNAVSKSLP